MFDFITAIITNLFRTYITKRFMQVFFEQDSGNKKKENITYGLFFILTVGVYLLFHYPLANIMTNIALIYAITCLYESEKKKKVMITFLVYGINMLCDAVAIYSFSDYTFGEEYNLIAAYITVLLISLCEFGIECILLKRLKGEITPPYWNVMLLIPGMSIIVILVLVVNDLNNRAVLISTSAGILGINLLVFYLYNAIIDVYKKLEETTAYEMQIASYANQLEVLQQTEKTVEALRHDMKHHLRELYSMSKKCANVEIMEYISDMQGFMSNQAEFVRSGNKEIDSVVNYMLGKAYKVLDRVECRINIPQDVKLNPFDATVIFGNLLENAIDAARICKGEKWISIIMQYEKGMLFVNVKNNYTMLIKNGNIYVTTKKEKGHGIGLQNVKRIVSTYNGSIDISHADNVFEIRILLYL